MKDRSKYVRILASDAKWIIKAHKKLTSIIMTEFCLKSPYHKRFYNNHNRSKERLPISDSMALTKSKQCENISGIQTIPVSGIVDKGFEQKLDTRQKVENKVKSMKRTASGFVPCSKKRRRFRDRLSCYHYDESDDDSSEGLQEGYQQQQDHSSKMKFKDFVYNTLPKRARRNKGKSFPHNKNVPEQEKWDNLYNKESEYVSFPVKYNKSLVTSDFQYKDNNVANRVFGDYTDTITYNFSDCNQISSQQSSSDCEDLENILLSGKSYINSQHQELGDLNDANYNTIPKCRSRIKTNPWLPSPKTSPFSSGMTSPMTSSVESPPSVTDSNFVQFNFDNINSAVSSHEGTNLSPVSSMNESGFSSTNTSEDSYKMVSPSFKTTGNDCVFCDIPQYEHDEYDWYGTPYEGSVDSDASDNDSLMQTSFVSDMHDNYKPEIRETHDFNKCFSDKSINTDLKYDMYNNNESATVSCFDYEDRLEKQLEYDCDLATTWENNIGDEAIYIDDEILDSADTVIDSYDNEELYSLNYDQTDITRVYHDEHDVIREYQHMTDAYTPVITCEELENKYPMESESYCSVKAPVNSNNYGPIKPISNNSRAFQAVEVVQQTKLHDSDETINLNMDNCDYVAHYYHSEPTYVFPIENTADVRDTVDCNKTARYYQHSNKANQTRKVEQLPKLSKICNSLRYKVNKLKHDKEVIDEMVHKSREEQRIRKQELVKIQKQTTLARKEILLKTLSDLRCKLEMQTDRLQSAYEQVINVQYNTILKQHQMY